jgi:hypothetical protein
MSYDQQRQVVDQQVKWWESKVEEIRMKLQARDAKMIEQYLRQNDQG